MNIADIDIENVCHVGCIFDQGHIGLNGSQKRLSGQIFNQALILVYFSLHEYALSKVRFGKDNKT